MEPIEQQAGPVDLPHWLRAAGSWLVGSASGHGWHDRHLIAIA
jgi:hypothetical protein